MQAQHAVQAQAQLNLQAQAAVSGAYPPLSAYTQARARSTTCDHHLVGFACFPNRVEHSPFKPQHTRFAPRATLHASHSQGFAFRSGGLAYQCLNFKA